MDLKNIKELSVENIRFYFSQGFLLKSGLVNEYTNFAYFENNFSKFSNLVQNPNVSTTSDALYMGIIKEFYEFFLKEFPNVENSIKELQKLNTEVSLKNNVFDQLLKNFNDSINDKNTNIINPARINRYCYYDSRDNNIPFAYDIGITNPLFDKYLLHINFSDLIFGNIDFKNKNRRYDLSKFFKDVDKFEDFVKRFMETDKMKSIVEQNMALKSLLETSFFEDVDKLVFKNSLEAISYFNKFLYDNNLGFDLEELFDSLKVKI